MPANPQGFATPDSSISLAVWMLCGASVDFGSSSYSTGDMSGNIYEGARGRVNRSDASKIQLFGVVHDGVGVRDAVLVVVVVDDGNLVVCEILPHS